jgi:DNA-binding NarL/FixJ family response regulator
MEKHLICATSSTLLAESLKECLSASLELAQPIRIVHIGSPTDAACDGIYDIFLVVLLNLEDVIWTRPLMERLRQRNGRLSTVAMIQDIHMSDLLGRFPTRFDKVLTEFSDFATVKACVTHLCRGTGYAGTLRAKSSVREAVKSVRRSTNYRFSARELDILRLVAHGFTTKEIAFSLGITVSTVANHRHGIYRKTDINSLQQLTVFAVVNHYGNDLP